VGYHPFRNKTDLPPIETVRDLDRLPWGGNAWWDSPIMTHVQKCIKNLDAPDEVKKAIAERAEYLTTGEECTFETEQDWLDYKEQL
jgi:hypothetical protein